MEKESRFSAFGAFAILSTAFLWIFEVVVVGPSMGVISAAFPESTQSDARYMMLIVYLTCFIFSILAGRLAKKYDKKKILLIGLLIYGITGMLPIFATSMSQIIVMRLITGIGVGLALPMTGAIIADHTSGQKRMKMLAMAAIVANIAGIVIVPIVGVLMVISWKASFYMFALALVIALVVLIGVPKSPPIKQENASTETPVKAKIPSIWYFYTACVAFIWCMNGVYPVNTAFFVMGETTLTPTLIGVLMMATPLGGIIGSYLFPKLNKVLKSFYVPVGLFVFAIGFVLLSIGHSLTFLLIASVVVGMAAGLLYPYALNVIAIRAKSPAQKDMGMGLLGASLPIGGFLGAPFCQLVFLANIPNAMTPYRFLFMASACLLLVIAIISIFLRAKKSTDLYEIEKTKDLPQTMQSAQ